MEKKTQVYIDHKKRKKGNKLDMKKKNFLGQERIWAVEPKAIHTQPII